ncbi:MAG: HipA domain-containing protein [Alphaproteobacteria bacterium]|nr:HipA domain-containing protein [Alphaproteobacteria bacterium]
MTSNKKECFVYITLPNQTEMVTAGKYVLEHIDRNIHQGQFIYGRSYLSRPDAVEIDPVELKLTSNSYETVLMKGIFGAIRDSSPDYWGRRVIENHVNILDMDEVDYLLNSADDRIGALGFGLNQTPPAPNRNFNQKIQLAALQEEAEKYVRDDVKSEKKDPIKAQVAELLLVGTSMGGARPKAVIEDNNKLWVAKFNRFDDKWNNALVEHAMLKLAEACGIETALHKIVTVANKDVLLLKRFDRENVEQGYLRYRMMSALTVLKAGDDYTQREKWSYISLAEELRRISEKPKEDAKELFKRMVFNALISNTDDHPRNHAFIAKNKTWKLSPAYDLTPNPLVSIESRDLAMICGDYGRKANKYNLLTQAKRFLLSDDEAKDIINRMEKIVSSKWYSIAKSAGVSENDCEKIRGAFVYEGFNYKP